MKDYVKNNQVAWDEAYQHASENYKDIVSKLKTNPKQYLNPLILTHLDPHDVKDKDIAQFACNNGRELLSTGMTYQAASMTGFDLSPTMVQDANASAKAMDAPASSS